jgi:hypothetical protein
MKNTTIASRKHTPRTVRLLAELSERGVGCETAIVSGYFCPIALVNAILNFPVAITALAGRVSLKTKQALVIVQRLSRRK